MLLADKRESLYCRYKIPSNAINSLGLKELQKGSYWIYASQPEGINKSNKEYPIIQSYVDLFITGCMQIQDRYLIKDFVKQCIQSTKYWDNKIHRDGMLSSDTINFSKKKTEHLNKDNERKRIDIAIPWLWEWQLFVNKTCLRCC